MVVKTAERRRCRTAVLGSGGGGGAGGGAGATATLGFEVVVVLSCSDLKREVVLLLLLLEGRGVGAGIPWVCDSHIHLSPSLSLHPLLTPPCANCRPVAGLAFVVARGDARRDTHTQVGAHSPRERIVSK